jgi:hypothetical protein
MKNRKATGPNGIKAELFEYGGEHLSNTLLISLINVGSLLEFQKPGMKPMLFHYLKKENKIAQQMFVYIV